MMSLNKKKLTTNLTLFLYVLSLYIFSYRENLNVFSNFFALILVFLIWINVFLTDKKIIINPFLIYLGFFIMFSSITVFYSIDGTFTIRKVLTMILIWVLLFSLVNYLRTYELIEYTLFCFILAGFLTSISILINADYNSFSRQGDTFGNVNAVGMMLSFSMVFSVYKLITKKNIAFNFIAIIVSMAAILLTGSRKAILFFVLSTLMILILSDLKNIVNVLKKIFISILLLVITGIVITKIPFINNVLGERLFNLLSFIKGDQVQDASLLIREDMIQKGFLYFKESPLLGFGLDNYRLLYGHEIGSSFTYSHNNFIELLVGVGLIGTVIYYLSHLNLLLSLKQNFGENKMAILFLVIIVNVVITSVGMVYYYDKHVNIILLLASVVAILSKKNQDEVDYE